jgi:solute carrier family 41
MMILSCGGIILEITSRRFEAMELYQPIINGVGGSLVSVQASRLSTYFHLYCKPGELPPKADLSPGNICQSPVFVFFKAGINSTAARVLLSLVIPGHLIFLTVTYFVSSNAQSSPLFVTVYEGAAIIQVASLLYLCQVVVNVVWFRKGDPDLFAIPVMTALGDLFGTVFLYIGLEIQNLAKHI